MNNSNNIFELFVNSLCLLELYRRLNQIHRPRLKQKPEINLAKICVKFYGRLPTYDSVLLYIKYLLKSYEESNNYTSELIADINDYKLLETNNLIKYLRIRNVLLKVQTLEITDPEKNNKDIISHLDCIFNFTKNTKEDFAICVGIKMLTLQSKEIISYEESIKLIEEMLNILKRETLFGKSHKNILDQ